MLILATFLTVSLAAVVILMRFLFAIESDIRSSSKRPATRVYIHRKVSRSLRPGQVLIPTLAYSNSDSWLRQHRVHRVFVLPSVKGA